MDLKNVRHLREILVIDEKGKTTVLMQYSSQNASHFRPQFAPVPLNDQARARELYLRWGGRRLEGMTMGRAVTDPKGKRVLENDQSTGERSNGRRNGNSENN